MRTSAERHALLAVGVLIIATGVVFAFSGWSGGAAPRVAAWCLLLAALLSVVSYFHLRLVRRVAEESLAEGGRSGEDTSLFAAPDDNIEAFTAEHALRQFQRVIVPAFTILFALGHLLIAGLQLRALPDVKPLPAESATATAALFAVIALVLYLGGKIQAALSHEKHHRLLLALAGYLLLCAAVCLLTAGAAVAVHFKYPLGDRIVAWAGLLVMALLGLEYIANAVLEIYRPRTGLEERPIYESRLTELLARPRGLFESIAQAVDYQFGFQVSQTWFFQLLERAVLPLVLVQLFSLYLLSCFAYVGPDEVGVVERWGRAQANATLSSGLHFKLPWPIDAVRKVPAKRVLTITIAGGQEEEHEELPVLLWEQGHQDAEFWLVAVRQQEAAIPSSTAEPSGDTDATSDASAEGEAAIPVNLVNLHAVINYEISDILQYAYRYADAKQALTHLAYRETSKLLVSADMFDLMGAQRLEYARQLRQQLQRRADQLKLGVRILFVGFEQIHPPAPTVPAFQDVIGAVEDAAAARLTAEVHASSAVPLARAKAVGVISEAQGKSARRTATVEAEAKAFAAHRQAYSHSPRVYRTRTYMEAVERIIGPLRKYIIAADQSSRKVTTIVNVEDKLRPELMDINLTGEEEESGS